MSLETWIHVAQTLLIGALIAGRWIQAREGGERVTAAQVADLKAALNDKADCDRVTDLTTKVKTMEAGVEERVVAEHKRISELNAALGAIRTEQARQDERLKGCERDVGQLRRKVFNGGGATNG